MSHVNRHLSNRAGELASWHMLAALAHVEARALARETVASSHIMTPNRNRKHRSGISGIVIAVYALRRGFALIYQ